MEKKENLKGWLDNLVDQRMKEAGFTVQTTPTQKNQQEATPVKGTITFLKEKSAKKAKPHSQKPKVKK